jgi:outer membrane protein assembly factor BamB
VVYLKFVRSGEEWLLARKAPGGAPLWTSSLGPIGGGGFDDSPPTIANGVLYVGSSDHNMRALDPSTGRTLFQSATGGPIFSSPAVVDGRVYVGSTDGNLYAFGLS